MDKWYYLPGEDDGREKPMFLDFGPAWIRKLYYTQGTMLTNHAFNLIPPRSKPELLILLELPDIGLPNELVYARI